MIQKIRITENHNIIKRHLISLCYIPAPETKSSAGFGAGSFSIRWSLHNETLLQHFKSVGVLKGGSARLYNTHAKFISVLVLTLHVNRRRNHKFTINSGIAKGLRQIISNQLRTKKELRWATQQQNRSTFKPNLWR